MDCDGSPTIETEFLNCEDDDWTSIRAVPELDENGEGSGLPTDAVRGSTESLASTTDVGCSRLLGDIQAELQADINAAKVL